MEFGAVAVPWWGMIGLFVIMLAGALSLVRNAVEIWDRTREHPPAHEKYATTIDLVKVEGKIDKLGADVRENMKSEAIARRGIHERINKILEGVAELRGQFARRG